MDLDLALREERPPELTEESTGTEKRYLEKWDRSNRMSVMIMKHSIPETFRGSMFDEEDVVTFLKEIKQRFVKNEKVETGNLLARLVSIRYKGNENIREYIMKMSNIASKLKALKLGLSDACSCI